MTNEETILNHDLKRASAAVEPFMEKSVYTTSALYAIGLWLIENGDDEGGDMVRQFALKFAKHEATQI